VSHPFRVGINAIFLEPGMGGIETYVRHLIPEVRRARPELELTVLCNASGRDLLAKEGWDGVELTVPRVMTRHGLRAAGELTVLGAIASRRFDVLHSPALTAPLRTKAANVVMIADVTWIVEPHTEGKNQGPTVRLWQLVVPRVARRADRLITLASAVSEQVVEHLHADADRIDAIGLGYEAGTRAQPTPEPDLRARLRIGSGPIVLNVGAKKVHKNQLRLIESLPAIRDSVRDAQLVIAGADTGYEESLRRRAAELGLADCVHLLGYIDDADLEGLYEASGAFVFPSLSEGFGLPLLEAMARKLPVVTSDRSVMPEVAGDAALLVDPDSADAIAAQTIVALNDKRARKHLIAAGTKRVADFTWQRTAELTIESWERALAQQAK
jgi:glycosyltransferase involved in cell wall biosynthesis